MCVAKRTGRHYNARAMQTLDGGKRSGQLGRDRDQSRPSGQDDVHVLGCRIGEVRAKVRTSERRVEKGPFDVRAEHPRAGRFGGGPDGRRELGSDLDRG